MITITAPGPDGAFEYHTRSYWRDFDYDPAAKTLIVHMRLDHSLEFRGIKLIGLSSKELVLEGTEVVPSGQGMLGPLRIIVISF